MVSHVLTFWGFTVLSSLKARPKSPSQPPLKKESPAVVARSTACPVTVADPIATVSEYTSPLAVVPSPYLIDHDPAMGEVVGSYTLLALSVEPATWKILDCVAE